MAFDQKQLSVLAYANGFTLWHYRTEDDVKAAQYFATAGMMVKSGDMLIVTRPDGIRLYSFIYGTEIIDIMPGERSDG